ncbi:DUF742 domain-containing protein [Lentzea sp. NPDC054927]
MTEPQHDAARDLVRRAHDKDPAPARFDTEAGLDDVLERAGGMAAAMTVDRIPEGLAHASTLWTPNRYEGETDATTSLVRPYARTGGRTRPAHDLALEALVSTSERGLHPDAAVTPEDRSICRLCAETRSVAEVAALLHLPLGVARILIADLAAAGLVVIGEGGFTAGNQPSADFLERVLSGLRRL